jgi:hypothetical protein
LNDDYTQLVTPGTHAHEQTELATYSVNNGDEQRTVIHEQGIGMGRVVSEVCVARCWQAVCSMGNILCYLLHAA